MTKKHGVHECSTIMHAEEYYYPSSKEATTIVQGNILCGHSGDHAGTTMNAVHDCAPRRAAIELNHEAVTLLRFGTEEGKALEIFKCALRLLKTELVSSSEARGGRRRPSAQGWGNHNDKDPRDSQVLPQFSSADLRLYSCHNHHKLSPIVAVPVSNRITRTASMTMLNDSPLFLYAKAFTFQFSNLDDHDDKSCLSEEILSSVIMYNIALVLNLKGIRTNSSTLLKKALDLYKLSLDAIHHDSLLGTSIVSKSLATACCNNIGQLAYMLCDFEHAETMRCMLQTLFLLTTSSLQEVLNVEHEGVSLAATTGKSSSLFLFEEVDMQGFESNLLFLYPPMTAPAA